MSHSVMKKTLIVAAKVMFALAFGFVMPIASAVTFIFLSITLIFTTKWYWWPLISLYNDFGWWHILCLITEDIGTVIGVIAFGALGVFMVIRFTKLTRRELTACWRQLPAIDRRYPDGDGARTASAGSQISPQIPSNVNHGGVDVAGG
jgi:hypothetical protein